MNWFNRLFALATTSVVALMLSACSHSSDTAATNPVPPPAAQTIGLTGVAAKGAALDGARIEVIDANGNLVDIGDTVTGSDGSYSVTLPAGVAMPVIIRATPPGGKPILSIVPDAGNGSSGLVANINPVTNLVSRSLLGNADPTDDGSLSTALSTVDPTTVKSSGDAIVQKVLGASVTYDSFADDPDFVASDGTSTGSAADTVLDTIAKQADSAGTTIDDALTLYAQASHPPQLLSQPAFQIDLVSEMVKKGTTNATDLESSLDSIGALPPAPMDGSKDVFRTVINVMPSVIDATKTSVGEVTDNQDQLNAAVDATVKLITDTIMTKETRFGSSDTDIANLLSSSSFQKTTAAVIDQTVKPIVKTVASDPNASQVVGALTAVIQSISTQASNVVSSFDYSDPATDVSGVVASYVANTVANGQSVTVDQLSAIESGSATTDSIVSGTGDVSAVQQDIVNYAQSTGADVSGAIQTLPTGVWDTAAWDSFNWG